MWIILRLWISSAFVVVIWVKITNLFSVPPTSCFKVIALSLHLKLCEFLCIMSYVFNVMMCFFDAVRNQMFRRKM